MAWSDWRGAIKRAQRTRGLQERPNKCCRDDSNLGPVVQERPDFSYRRCSVCDCRHFEQLVDPARLGIQPQ